MPTNYMEGLVTSYSGTTLVVNVDTTGGAGTAADWNLNLAGNAGAQGPAGPAGSGSGDVTGPSNSNDGDPVVFNGATGKIIKAGAKPIRSFGATLFSLNDVAVLPPLPFACQSISGTHYWNISIQGSGTATVDIARVTAGTSIPAFPANSITASAAPAIASNNNVSSTTMTGWCGGGTCAWAYHDSVAFKLTALSGPTSVSISMECQ
jgi:hypothetical protein